MRLQVILGFLIALLCSSLHKAYAFPRSTDQESYKFTCVYEKHTKWYLEVDFSAGVMYSYELYRDKQTLEYQTYSRVDDDHVYEFKSADFSESNSSAYLAYFNPQKLVVTIIRVNTKPGEEIKSYQFTCAVDNRHLLLIQ